MTQNGVVKFTDTFLAMIPKEEKQSPLLRPFLNFAKRRLFHLKKKKGNYCIILHESINQYRAINAWNTINIQFYCTSPPLRNFTISKGTNFAYKVSRYFKRVELFLSWKYFGTNELVNSLSSLVGHPVPITHTETNAP